MEVKCGKNLWIPCVQREEECVNAFVNKGGVMVTMLVKVMKFVPVPVSVLRPLTLPSSPLSLPPSPSFYPSKGCPIKNNWNLL